MSAPNCTSGEDDADPIAEIHEIRRQMAAECNYDPYEMGRRLREQERASGRKLYRTERVLLPVETSYATEEAEPPTK